MLVSASGFGVSFRSASSMSESDTWRHGLRHESKLDIRSDTVLQVSIKDEIDNSIIVNWIAAAILGVEVGATPF